MHIDTEARDGHRVIRPRGELTIYQAGEAKSLLLAALDPGTPVELDLGEISEIDCAGVQLLLMTVRELRRNGVAARVSRCSDTTRRAFDLLGLGDLGEPAAPALDQPAPGAATPGDLS